MIVGIDLDNTIIDYSNVLLKISREKRLNTNKNLKENLKKFLLQKSKKEWTKLQGEIYGNRIFDAKIYKGFLQFLKFAKKNDIKVIVISHKTKFPIIGKKHNLHKFALDFLNKNTKKNIFKPNKNLFFERTINKKLKKIKEVECDYFIDDLEKIFLNKNFPFLTKKLLFKGNDKKIKSFDSWKMIISYFKNQIKENKKLKGRNNKSYTLDKNIFIKKFLNSSLNFKRELKFSSFLSDNHIKYIPKIKDISKKNLVIKYEYIENDNKNFYFKHKEKLILESFKFIKNINKLEFEKQNFKLATDFCKNSNDYKKEINRRLTKHKKSKLIEKDKRYRDLLNKIKICFDSLKQKKYFSKNLVNTKKLILSPCDFHSENMLFSKKIHFIDFEYSGLDDPAKVYSVFFLQPELNIKLDLFRKIIDKVLFFNNNKEIFNRILYLMPIIYIRWALIILNKLSKQKKNDYKTMSKDSLSKKNLQLNKAEKYLKSRYPYFEIYKKFI